MINKFKDFLKQKFSRKESQDSSDQTQEFSRISLSTESKFQPFLDKMKALVLRKSENGQPALSPNLSRAIERVFSREARESVHQISVVVIVCVATYTLGKLTALVVRGAPALPTAQNYSISIPLEKDFNVATLNQVKSINVFRTNSGLKANKKVADTKCEESDSKSGLPINLVNTIVLQDTVKSIASVQVRGDRVLKEIRVGDQIESLAKVAQISRLHILVKNMETGACEYIANNKLDERASRISIMSPAQGRAFLANKKISGIDNEGNKFKIKKSFLDEKLKDIGSILTQAKALQIQNPDGSLSFKMTEMDPNGLFPYLGLQDQDIITSINGKPIYNLNEVMMLFGNIKNLSQLSLGVRREGSESVQEYSINK